MRYLLLVWLPVLAASKRPAMPFHDTTARWYSGRTGSSRRGVFRRAPTFFLSRVVATFHADVGKGGFDR